MPQLSHAHLTIRHEGRSVAKKYQRAHMLRLRSLVLRSTAGPRGGLALTGWRANSTTATTPAAAVAMPTGAAGKEHIHRARECGLLR